MEDIWRYTKEGLYIDDDGYVCYMDDKVFWTLHYNGWEAFLPKEDVPCYSSGEMTFPTDDELAEVMEMHEKWAKQQEEK